MHGSLLDHLAHNRRTTGLVIVSARNHQHLNELIGPIGSAVLQDTECSLLVFNHQHL
jgi:hypothetical protein